MEKIHRFRCRVGHIYPIRRRLGHIYPLKRLSIVGCESKVKDKVVEIKLRSCYFSSCWFCI